MSQNRGILFLFHFCLNNTFCDLLHELRIIMQKEINTFIVFLELWTLLSLHGFTLNCKNYGNSFRNWDKYCSRDHWSLRLFVGAFGTNLRDHYSYNIKPQKWCKRFPNCCNFKYLGLFGTSTIKKVIKSTHSVQLS